VSRLFLSRNTEDDGDGAPGAAARRPRALVRVGFLWELSRTTPSLGLAVRRGRLLWLSAPIDGDQQQLDIYDFCVEELLPSSLAPLSLAKDDATGRATSNEYHIRAISIPTGILA
jgi:hypothetical protein